MVKEDLGRLALDDVTKRFTETQKELGVTPSAKKAEEFIRPIFDEVIRKNEIDAVPAAPAATAPTAPKSKLERGEVPEGSRVILAGDVDAAARLRAKQEIGRQAKLLLDRYQLIHATDAKGEYLYPDWVQRLKLAGEAGDQAAMFSGAPEDRTNIHRRWAIVTEYLMKVIEDSNRVFGDYLNPKAKPTKIVVGGK